MLQSALGTGEPPFAPRDVSLTNRFGSSTLQAKKDSLVCLPSQLVTAP